MMTASVEPYLVAIIAGVLALFLIIASLRRGRRRRFPYQAVASLHSAAELRFFNALESAIGKQARIYAKVRLADVVRVEGKMDRSRFFRAFNAIACKHVDYVLCEPNSHAVLCVIELDDSSHQRPDRQARDAFVDSVMRAAGIPILHFPVQGRYVIKALREELRGVL